MYPKITLAEYKNFCCSCCGDHYHGDGRPYAFFDNHPDIGGKARALMFVAQHVKWSERDVNTFIGQYKDQIRALLTEKPVCPPCWTDAEVVSYANIVIRVINENERM